MLTSSQQPLARRYSYVGRASVSAVATEATMLSMPFPERFPPSTSPAARSRSDFVAAATAALDASSASLCRIAAEARSLAPSPDATHATRRFACDDGPHCSAQEKTTTTMSECERERRRSETQRQWKQESWWTPWWWWLRGRSLPLHVLAAAAARAVVSDDRFEPISNKERHSEETIAGPLLLLVPPRLSPVPLLPICCCCWCYLCEDPNSKKGNPTRRHNVSPPSPVVLDYGSRPLFQRRRESLHHVVVVVLRKRRKKKK